MIPLRVDPPCPRDNIIVQRPRVHAPRRDAQDPVHHYHSQNEELGRQSRPSRPHRHERRPLQQVRQDQAVSARRENLPHNINGEVWRQDGLLQTVKYAVDEVGAEESEDMSSSARCRQAWRRGGRANPWECLQDHAADTVGHGLVQQLARPLLLRRWVLLLWWVGAAAGDQYGDEA